MSGSIHICWEQPMISIICATQEELLAKVFNTQFTDYYRTEAARELARRINK